MDSDKILNIMHRMLDASWKLNMIMAEGISFVLDNITGKFGFTLPPELYAMVTSGIGLMLVVYSIHKNFSTFKLLIITVVAAMMAGGVLNFFGIIPGA